MIVPPPCVTDQIWINTYRPSIFCDKDRDFWRTFHDLIKSSTVPIRVNGAFNMIESIIEENSCYGGGSFNYMFWFETESDREQFVMEVERAVPNCFNAWAFPDLQRRELETVDGGKCWIGESEILRTCREKLAREKL